MPAPTPPDLASGLHRLHTALDTLAAHPEVMFRTRQLGAPAPAELLAEHRSRQLPAELLALYEQVNGLEIAWEFTDGTEGGYLCLPPLTPDSFTTRADRLTFARPGDLALRFTQDRYPSGPGSWLWRSAAHPAFRVVYDYRSAGEDAIVVADSVAAFLHQVAAHYFVDEYAPGTERAREVAERLRAQPPAVPGALEPGSRVRFALYSRYRGEPEGRGTLVRRHTLTQPNPLAGLFTSGRDTGNYALVQLDLGPRYWMLFEHLKPLPPGPPDWYEQVHQDPHLLLHWGQTLGWEATLRRLAMLVGPLASLSNNFATGSYHVAALLGALPLPAAFELMRELVAGLEAGRDSRPRLLELTEEEKAGAYNTAGWKKTNWVDAWESIVRILLSGMKARLLYEPPATRRALPKAAVVALEAVTRIHYNTYSTKGNKTLFGDMQKLRLGHPLALTPPSLGLQASIPELPEPAGVLVVL